MLGKTDWYSAEKKIILTIALAILIASVSVFAILYLMMSHALQEDIRARARVVNAYAESHLNLEGFVHINTLKDMRRDTYQDMQSMLDNIRQIANVRYLYTAKFNDRGQPMYLVDGLPPNSSDFRSPGDLIEQDIVPMLNRCLSGELIESDGVLNTEWGAIFLTCMPAYTIGEAEPIGAVVMEFNADVIYKSKLRAMLYSGALALVIVGGCTFITMLCLRRLATPFYKKLAYTDMLTGIGNRTAFELELKNLEKRLPHPFTIVAYDLNYMKRINDTYGHAEGDRAIQEIGHILSGALVANSVAIRMSGDEFMVLIRHGSEELLNKTCAAIEQRVQHYNETAPAGSFQLSFSTGVAKYEGGSVEKFLAELDERMYAEKRAFHAARNGHAVPEQGNAPSISE